MLTLIQKINNMVVEKKEKINSPRTPEEILISVNHLPVASLREEIRHEIRQHDNLVVVAETGSGKTTCLPHLLLELRNELDLPGTIAVTQPRRVATRSVTKRVAEMVGCEVGQKVGYNIRFENVTDDSTDITFMTDGILLRKIQFDPLLTEYSIVMVDEAHERSLNIDLCLGLLKEVNELRLGAGIEPIYIVISSATIERSKFASFIGGQDSKNSIEIPGKMFPVEVYYETEVPYGYDFTKGAAEKVKSILDQDLLGDILIFMPGKQEICDTIDKIKELIGDKSSEIIPLHAELPPEEQDRIFLPSEKRKIIVSTNVAETSVTIDGIIHVIDSGLVKETHFNPSTGIEQLVLVEHALSGLEQRKGRAGRTAPGFCYRLFTESSLRRRLPYQTPEIQRSNLAQIVLAMKKVGIQNIADFRFLDHPGRHSINQAIETLIALGALDKNGDITDIGEYMSEMGLEPRLSRMVIEATRPEINCVNEICTIAAFLEGKTVFVRPVDEIEQLEADRLHQQFKKNKNSDFAVILDVWNAFVKNNYDVEWAKKNYLNEKCLEEAKNVRLELFEILEKHDIHVEPEDKPSSEKNTLGKAIAAGLIGNLMRYSRRFRLKKVDGKKEDINFHPSSIFIYKSVKEGALIVSDEIFMNHKGKAYACNCMEVKPEWFKDIAPEVLHDQTTRTKNAQKNSSRKVFDRRNRKKR